MQIAIEDLTKKLAKNSDFNIFSHFGSFDLGISS